MVPENSWHSVSVEEAFESLKTSQDGLTEAEVKERLARYGANELVEEKGQAS